MGQVSGQIQSQDEWIAEQMSRMSVREKIGQLFVIRANSTDDEKQQLSVENLIRNYAIGGICFFQGKASKQIELIQKYQLLSKIPLMISMDAEFGPAMRLKQDALPFPKQLTLGAIDDNQMIFDMGKEVARQLRCVGVHMNYAPCVDIYVNPKNPVINDRSFGSDRYVVTEKALAYMEGMQAGGILNCLKHFPGHGDTEVDSHLDLPLVSHDRRHMDSLELYPYRILMNSKPDAVMVGHIQIPALDTQANRATSLSHKVVSEILKDEYHFEGLVITDALEMKGVAKHFVSGELELEALKAGNDILLLSENVPVAIDRIEQAINSGEISVEDINLKLIKILRAKWKLQLYKPILPSVENISTEINAPEAKALRDKIYRKSITLIKDNFQQVPIRDLKQKTLFIAVGVDEEPMFLTRCRKYLPKSRMLFSKTPSSLKISDLELAKFDHIIISIHKTNYKFETNYGLSDENIQFVKSVCKSNKVSLVIFGNPHVADFFQDASAQILCYEENTLSQDITAQLLFGTDAFTGRCPVRLKENTQGTIIPLTRPSLQRLGYAEPEAVGLASSLVEKIDTIAQQLIQDHASPGCQILVARRGKIVYQKSFGYLRYDSLEPVTENTIYDLASITKIAATVPALMILDDYGKVNLNSTLASLIPSLEGSNKADIKLKDILLHQSRMVSWIPFYKASLISPDTLNIRIDSFYRTERNDSFQLEICNHEFMRNDFLDTVFSKIINSRLHTEKKYLYSDLGFYFIPQIIGMISGKSFERFLQERFYNTLGLETMTFNPLKSAVPLSQIAPSECDHYWRQEEVQGYVHDMGAAITHGISGHAGLFSNAMDLAIIMQCYLNLGNYGGHELISSGTVRYYTARDGELMRRGIGFDLPELGPNLNPYISTLASPKTFGHQGFTGTCAWVDPAQEIMYIFLSNRTFPDSSQNKLHKNRYRTKIQDSIYNSILP